MAIDPNTGIDDAAPGGIAPPDNQAVLDYIAGQRAAFQPNYADETWDGSVSGYLRGASQPGMSGYFDYDPSRGGIVPHVFSVPQVADQAGVTPGELAGGFFPRDQGSGIRYNIPNDQGAFFTAQGLFGRGVPPIGSTGAWLPSTNNWRLFGGIPGQIMRNGNIINMFDPSGWRGAAAGVNTGPGGSAESGSRLGGYSNVGTGVPGGVPNVWNGAFGWPGQTTTYNYDRGPWGTNV